MNKEQEKKFFELICVCNNQQQELERYKNIIDELEKYLKEEYEYYDKKINAGYGYAMGEINRIRNKLKELKGE